MTHRLMFQGDERKYKLREVKFFAYMRTQKLYNIITTGTDDKINHNKKAEAFGELV